MSIKEHWLPIKNWETVYEVSNLGRVRRIKDGIRGGKAGTIMSLSPDKDGYLQVRLSNGLKNRRNGKVHRLVVEVFIGIIPDGYVVNHLDGNKANNVISNLEIATHSQNQLHAYRVLKRPVVSNKGEAAGRAKLSNEQVVEIRQRYAEGDVSQQFLANQFGISQWVVSAIVRRMIWTHI